MEECACSFNECNNHCECEPYFENSIITGKRQFTCLQDKNGKDIYEGDYLNMIPNDALGFITTIKNKVVKYEVRIERCDFILYRTDIKLNWGRLSRVEEMGWNCEVIGNIYENQDLISQAT